MIKDYTKQQKEAYLNTHNCPKCSSSSVEGGSIYFESGSLSQELLCNDCDEIWYDIYTLTDIERRI